MTDSAARPAVWVTRPKSVAVKTAQRLAQKGYAVLTEPLLEIVFTLSPPPVCETEPALVLTSQTAILAAQTQPDLFTPYVECACYCVGDQTATAARSFGFKKILSVQPDGTHLAQAMVAQEPSDKILLHLGGENLSAQPAQAFAQAGRDYRHWSLYRTDAVKNLTAESRRWLQGSEKGAVLFYSPRTAETFVKLIKQDKLEACCKQLIAIGLSPVVTHALGPLEWRHCRASEQATEESLIQALTQRKFR
ncbi:MAG: uroporphyrinogen-III synthase [Bdellovibrionales bacterium]